MIISIVSALPRSGASVLTALLGCAMGYSQELETLLMYDDPDRTLPDYLAIDKTIDKTNSLSQLFDLLREKLLAPESVKDYCMNVATNVDLLDTYVESARLEKVQNALKYIANKNSYDMTLIDLHTWEDGIIAKSDCVVIVFRPDNASYKAVESLREKLKDKKVLYVCNYYDEAITATRKIAKKLGVSHYDFCKLHYSPFLTKECLKRSLDTTIPFILKRDPDVAEFNTDIKECMQWLLSNTSHKLKWEV